MSFILTEAISCMSEIILLAIAESIFPLIHHREPVELPKKTAFTVLKVQTGDKSIIFA